ncbi:hypothetical protein ACUN3E_37705 [Streptomyces sp. Ju416(a)]|uniref:hypothetical protein n=1 Tax=Streptomyces sp. Ju416(a) TaxID=3446591 RepID=UPI00403D65AD
MDPIDEFRTHAEQRQQELDRMNADFEAIDAAEYAQFNADQDVRDSARTTDS